MSGQSFLYGTAVLLAASIFNRFIGFIYQILMMRLIKPEGVGLFSMVFPIYIMIVVISTMGIPVAISKLVAEEVAKNNLSGAYRIFKISLAIISCSGLFFTLLLSAGSKLLIKHIFPNPDVYLCLISLFPAIFIVSLCSAFRGFFQGLQRMSPTAFTQAIEQVVRVTAGLSIAWFLLPYGAVYASVGISLGIMCGELAGFLIMVYIFLTRRPQAVKSPGFLKKPLSGVLKNIFDIGIPVTLTRFVSTALMSIDALLIPRRLQMAGMSVLESTATYGQFVGITEALFFTPGVITIALSTSLIPAISDALARNRSALLHSRIEDAVRLTIFIGAPVAGAFLAVPELLCQVLFGYGTAGQTLFVLALSAPFLYLQQTTTGILQGLGKADAPFKNLLKASAIKLLGIYYLTSIPGFGITGTAISLGATYIITATLNYYDLKKITGVRINRTFIIYKPVVAAAAAAMIMLQLRMLLFTAGLPGFLCLPACIVLGAASYFLVLYLIGGISSADVIKIKTLLKKNN